jgi:hypothetical protein
VLFENIDDALKITEMDNIGTLQFIEQFSVTNNNLIHNPLSHKIMKINWLKIKQIMITYHKCYNNSNNIHPTTKATTSTPTTTTTTSTPTTTTTTTTSTRWTKY